MKTSFIQILFHFVCLCAFVSIMSAQEKPQALKFDEFGGYEDGLILTERAKRFAVQFRKFVGAKAYIIYYQRQISNVSDDSSLKRKLDQARWDIRPEDDYVDGTVQIVNGGYREDEMIEFWIVPKNAEPPTPTPTVDKSETFVCPRVGVSRDYLPSEPDTLRFSISDYELKETPDYVLNWKVFGGEIVGDQKSNEIKVKLNNNGKRATVFAEIEGLPFPCPKVFPATATVKGKLQQIDEFGREPNGQIRGRLDNFLTKLVENPTALGYVINYGSRKEGKRYLEARNKNIRNYTTLRNADTSRITFVEGGYRETEATELWLSFDANQKPVPTPTVDKRFVETVKPIRKTRPRK